MESQTEIPRWKRLFLWFGIEANYRAVTCLLAIGATLGGLAIFVGSKVLPVYSPTLSVTEFGEGYRRGKRESELVQQVAELETLLEQMRKSEKIRLEVENMTDEELKKFLME